MLYPPAFSNIIKMFSTENKIHRTEKNTSVPFSYGPYNDPNALQFAHFYVNVFYFNRILHIFRAKFDLLSAHKPYRFSIIIKMFSRENALTDRRNFVQQKTLTSKKNFDRPKSSVRQKNFVQQNPLIGRKAPFGRKTPLRKSFAAAWRSPQTASLIPTDLI